MKQHIYATVFLSLFAIGQVPVSASGADEDQLWVEYKGSDGPGKGKHVVLFSGDDEYRSEEALPQLGKILAVRHGFDCTVLFSVNPDDGTINPEEKTNIPGIEAIAKADLLIIATRFRKLPDDEMKYVDDYVNSGKPIIGMRTATHAFNYGGDKASPYAKYSYNAGGDWEGGFGQQVLGDTWISHHGHHKVESTRGIIDWQHRNHPILNSVRDVWGPTDVYGIRNLGDDAKVLLHGQVLKGMQPTDEPVVGEKNNPMMPLFWTKTFTGSSGKASRVVNTTMGSSTDLECEDLRRALVNSVYWGLEMDVPAQADVDFVGEYNPTPYGFGNYQKGIKPSAHNL
ncbi:MAG: ThuA domain-containing protein [Planctomycetales bacterium]|nr:ThuA domain-containing protein [Planctomycetales bacterium]